MNKTITNNNELKRSLFLVTLSIVFGKFYFIVISEAPYTGFIRALGVNDFIYSMLSALPLFASVLQIIASYILENTGKRKMLFLISVYVHRLIWIPIVIMPLLLPSGHNTLLLSVITALIGVYSVANSFVNISYFSWMGDLIPFEIKGRFFGRRMAISTITGIVAGVAVGIFLGDSPSLYRFALVFTIAALFGAGDGTCFAWVKDPPMKTPQKRIGLFTLFFEPFKNKNYVKLILFMSVWNFGFNFAVPFFNIYMLENLKMSYFIISIFVQFIGNISVIFLINYLGKLADKFGNKPVIALCCIFLTIIPLMWCFATPGNFYIVMFVIHFINGIFTSGIQLTSSNMSIWLAPEKNRSIYVANFTLITSLASALAYVLGGSFMELNKQFIDGLKLPFVFGQTFNSYHSLFIVSSLLRLLAIVVFLPLMEEDNAKPVAHMIKSIGWSAKTGLFHR